MYIIIIAIALILAGGSLYSIAKNPHKKRMHRTKVNTTRI